MEPIQLRAMRLLKRSRPLVDGLSSTHVAARQPLVAVGRCAARVLACAGCESANRSGFCSRGFSFYRSRAGAAASSDASA